MKIYLAAHYRSHAHGTLINAASIAVHGARGVFGHTMHATHVYVVAIDGALGFRLDGDIPTSRTRSLGGLAASGICAPRWWRMPDDGAREALKRAMALVEKPARYDELEILQAGAQATAAALGLPLPPVRGDHLRTAMICTRLASRVLGLDVPDLFPESCVKAALSAGYVPVRVADALEGVVVP